MAAYYASHALEKEPHPLLSKYPILFTVKSHLTPSQPSSEHSRMNTYAVYTKTWVVSIT